MFKQGREGGRRVRINILFFLHAPSFLCMRAKAGGGEEPEVCSLGAGQGKFIMSPREVSGFWSVTCYCVTAVLMEHVSRSSVHAASKQL